MKARAGSIAAVILLGVVSIEGAAQVCPGRWRVESDTGPAARQGARMRLDEARNVIVLFGGVANGVQLGDTWEWDGETWTAREIAGPAARSYFGMTYDSARGVMVLFGGDAPGAGVAFGDTWEYDGTEWRLVATNGPAPRRGTALVYDSVRGVCVLFGGYDDASIRYSDTWEWDGATWTARTAGVPSARTVGDLAYDPIRQRTVLFGGSDGSNDLGDTWEWDGGSWALIEPPASPDARTGMGMAYLPSLGKVMMYAGSFNNGIWSWDGAEWIIYAPPSIPLGRNWPSLSTGIDRESVLSFGGTTGILQRETLDWRIVTLQVLSQSGQTDAVRWEPVELSVVAEGNDSLTYEWRRDGVTLADGGTLSGSLTPTLVISRVEPADAGQYTLVIRDTCGEIESAPIELRVTDPYQLEPAITLEPVAELSELLHTVGASKNGAFGSRRVVRGGDLLTVSESVRHWDEGDRSNPGGAGHVFRRVDGQWVYEALLEPDGTQGLGAEGAILYGDYIATDGVRVVLGSWNGVETYVYKQDEFGIWIQEAVLDDGAWSDTASERGPIAIAGTTIVRSLGAPVEGLSGSSARVQFFELIDGQWQIVQEIVEAGIGAGIVLDQGKCYITQYSGQVVYEYERGQTGWVLAETIASGGHDLGGTLAVRGDVLASGVLTSGLSGEGVSVFKRHADGWQFFGHVASPSNWSYFFGEWIAVDGSLLVVPYSESGDIRAHIYSLDGDAPQLIHEIIHEDAAGTMWVGINPAGVEIVDGLVYIGSPGDDSVLENSGTVRAYDSADGFNEVEVIAPPTPDLVRSGDFATRMNVSGKRLTVVSGPLRNRYNFEKISGSWVLRGRTPCGYPISHIVGDEFVSVDVSADIVEIGALTSDGCTIAQTIVFPDEISSTAFDGATLVIADQYSRLVDVYQRGADAWEWSATLAPAQYVPTFGNHVRVSGQVIAVTSSSGLHVFEQIGSGWVETAVIDEITKQVEIVDGALFAVHHAVFHRQIAEYSRDDQTGWVETDRFNVGLHAGDTLSVVFAIDGDRAIVLDESPDGIYELFQFRKRDGVWLNEAESQITVEGLLETVVSLKLSDTNAFVGTNGDGVFGARQGLIYVYDFPSDPEPTTRCRRLACDAADISPAGGDCLIDLADLGVVLANFTGAGSACGKSREEGDLYPVGGDGCVDLSDLGEVLAIFGEDCR